MNKSLNSVIKRMISKASVLNPNAFVTAKPYKKGKALTPSNAFEAGGFPRISFPGATGVKGGASFYDMMKTTIIYGQPNQEGFFGLGGGWTYSAFDRPPEGSFFNKEQV